MRDQKKKKTWKTIKEEDLEGL